MGGSPSTLYSCFDLSSSHHLELHQEPQLIWRAATTGQGGRAGTEGGASSGHLGQFLLVAGVTGGATLLHPDKQPMNLGQEAAMHMTEPRLFSSDGAMDQEVGNGEEGDSDSVLAAGVAVGVVRPLASLVITAEVVIVKAQGTPEQLVHRVEDEQGSEI